MLRLYLKTWEWEWISSPSVRSPWGGTNNSTVNVILLKKLQIEYEINKSLKLMSTDSNIVGL